MPACPLSTLRRPPRERPTHDSESRLVANHYHVGTFTHYSLPAFTGAFTTSPSARYPTPFVPVGVPLPLSVPQPRPYVYVPLAIKSLQLLFER